MDDELARYRSLCERIRACWTGKGMMFSCPPATEEQLQVTEEQLGYPLPPLLRMLYKDVANGGNGLIWEEDQFPLIGAHGGYPSPPRGRSPDGRWLPGPTIEQLVSHSGWRLHPCIEDALRRHPGRSVVCSQPPEGFVSIGDAGSFGYELDLVSGCVYASWFGGDLPLEDNQVEPLLELNFYRSSLEELIGEFLAQVGCGVGSATGANRPPMEYGDLTQGMLDPACEANAATVWRGLYRGVEQIIHPDEPDEAW